MPLHDAHASFRFLVLDVYGAQERVFHPVRVVRVAQERLTQLGGAPERHEVSDEALQAAEAADTPAV